jgi:endonuclease YncB( thermonuclease family)
LPVRTVEPRPVRAIPAEPAAPAPPLAPRRGYSLDGSAQATGPTSLAVTGVPIRLYGIREAETGQSCPAPNGAKEPCETAARRMIEARLAGHPRVHCRISGPPGEHQAIAVCLDAQGVDLAGLLVGAGLVLANHGEAADYTGAEAVARSQQRGLWRRP